MNVISTGEGIFLTNVAINYVNLDVFTPQSLLFLDGVNIEGATAFTRGQSQ